MKIKLLVISALMSYGAFAQQQQIETPKEKKNIIKGGFAFNFLSIEAPEYGLSDITPSGLAIGFERKFNHRVSWGINLSGTGYTSILSGTSQDFGMSVFMINPQFRYYFTGSGLKGFYLANNLNFGAIEIKQGSASTEIGGVGFGFDIGYQWLSKKNWTAECFIGADFMELGTPNYPGVDEELIPSHYYGGELGIRFGYNF